MHGPEGDLLGQIAPAAVQGATALVGRAEVIGAAPTDRPPALLLLGVGLVGSLDEQRAGGTHHGDGLAQEGRERGLRSAGELALVLGEDRAPGLGIERGLAADHGEVNHCVTVMVRPLTVLVPQAVIPPRGLRVMAGIEKVAAKGEQVNEVEL